MAEYYRQQGEDIQCRIADYGRREKELQRQKSSVESNLSGQRSVLQSNQSRLADAQSALRSAEQRILDKEREAAVFGFLLLPFWVRPSMNSGKKRGKLVGTWSDAEVTAVMLSHLLRQVSCNFT